MNFSRILGTGSYLPSQILTNADLEKRVDTSDAWITERTGIKERRIAAPEESAASMGLIAAERALAQAGLTPDKIDLIIVATSTPDKIMPNTASLLQGALRSRTVGALDVNAACSGFMYALAVADQFIRAGSATHVLVVGSEVMSRLMDWTDRNTCVLFGDGAGAVVLGASHTPGILSTHLHAEGGVSHLLTVDNPQASAHPALCDPYMRMQGNELFRVAVKRLGEIVDETLVAHQLDQSALDWLIPHQANHRILQATAKRLKLPMSQVVVTLDRQGNTSAASIPLALDEAVRAGKIQAGQLLLLESFGGGLTWASALVKW